ncbi:MAG: ABC transporter permease [Terriglobia bacterium]|nr:MAG: ABC transporter permease [Terriglobia bacterium]
MTGKLVLENLKHRPMRSLLSTLLIGVPVTLILTLVGLSHGMINDSARRTQGIGAHIIVRPPGSSFLSLSGAPLDQRIVDNFFARQPHVQLAVGVVNQPVEGIFLGLTGVDLEKFSQMSGGVEYLEGGPFRASDDVIVDDYYASQHHLHPGDAVRLLNTTWRVSGVFRGGKLAHIIVPIDSLQQKISSTGKISQIYLKLDNPANIPAVMQDLKKRLPDYQIYSMQEMTALYNVNNVPLLSGFIGVVIGVGVVIGFLVVSLSMYMAVLQRTREIGILKSLGASNGFILRMIWVEALALGAGGTLLGIGMSFGAWGLIAAFVPIPVEIVTSWWPIAAGITLAGASFGALYPGLRAARHDPIEALAYE